MGITFHRALDVRYGASVTVAPDIRRVLAPNPSPFTFHGTGTYIIGQGRVAVIDPGPALGDHVEALLDAVRGETVTHLLVTHTHLDHSPAAAAIKAATGAETYGFGPHGGVLGGARNGDVVEEGADYEFRPDHLVADGDVIEGTGWRVRAVHTPGHTSNHLCFALESGAALFSGDHVMGWSTTVVSPPDGDMAAYMASLTKLKSETAGAFWPTHGPAIPNPQSYLGALIAHREARSAAILTCLENGITRIPEIVSRLYAEIDPRLHGAAARSVLAHLIQLVEEGDAACDGPPTATATYRRRP